MKNQQTTLTELAKHPIRNYYTGSGKHTKKSADHVSNARNILLAAGMIAGRHFICDNDAPRGGWCGDYIKLTANGRNLKIVRQAIVNSTQLTAKKTEKTKKYLRSDAEKRLPLLCRERLLDNLSKNHRKSLNAEIRHLAEICGEILPPTGESLLEFLRQSITNK